MTGCGNRQADERRRQNLRQDAVLARSKYLSDFYRSCNELGLSPQARAKLGVLAASKKAEETDPLVKALSDDDDD